MSEKLTNDQVIDQFTNNDLQVIFQNNPGQNEEDLEELITYEFGLYTDALFKDGSITEEQLEIDYPIGD